MAANLCFVADATEIMSMIMGAKGGAGTETSNLDSYVMGACARICSTIAAARAADEVADLRTQLGAAHSKTAALQEQLAAVEAELVELHDAHTMVCDELQEQRLAMTAAMTQCQSLQQQLDSQHIT